MPFFDDLGKQLQAGQTVNSGGMTYMPMYTGGFSNETGTDPGQITGAYGWNDANFNPNGSFQGGRYDLQGNLLGSHSFDASSPWYTNSMLPFLLAGAGMGAGLFAGAGAGMGAGAEALGGGFGGGTSLAELSGGGAFPLASSGGAFESAMMNLGGGFAPAASDAAFEAAMAGGGAGFAAGGLGGGGGGGGFAPAASDGAFSSAIGGTGEGFAPAASNAAFESAIRANPWSPLDSLKYGVQNLFDSGGSLFKSGGSLFGPGAANTGGGILQGALKFGTPLMQILAGLEARRQAKSLQSQMQLPNPGDITKIPGYQAGLEAVQRSMAAQGYQGSGNMMAALAKYGGDFYNQYVNQRLASAEAQSGPASGGISGLALLASGLGGFARAF